MYHNVWMYYLTYRILIVRVIQVVCLIKVVVQGKKAWTVGNLEPVSNHEQEYVVPVLTPKDKGWAYAICQ